MIREFEGKTEQEAIALAIAELKIEQEDIDIEVIGSGKRSLFKKGPVRIRVRVADRDGKDDGTQDVARGPDGYGEELAPEGVEQEVVDFLSTLLIKMGYPGSVKVTFRKEGKLMLDIKSEYSSIIIGRKGKNLDAIQLIVNVFAGQLNPDMKVVIDSEDYRLRHEEQLVRLAYRTAEQVKRNGKSRLLEPMNPFERRLIHTALNDVEGVTTKSEGEGLFKQVRISIDDELPPLRR